MGFSLVSYGFRLVSFLPFKIFFWGEGGLLLVGNQLELFLMVGV